MLLCDADGFALAEIPSGVQAPGFNFTVYLRSNYIRELDQAGALIFEELDPNLRKLLDAARNAVKDHFRRRKAESAVNIVKEWKEQDDLSLRRRAAEPPRTGRATGVRCRCA